MKLQGWNILFYIIRCEQYNLNLCELEQFGYNDVLIFYFMLFLEVVKLVFFYKYMYNVFEYFY